MPATISRQARLFRLQPFRDACQSADQPSVEMKSLVDSLANKGHQISSHLRCLTFQWRRRRRHIDGTIASQRQATPALDSGAIQPSSLAAGSNRQLRLVMSVDDARQTLDQLTELLDLSGVQFACSTSGRRKRISAASAEIVVVDGGGGNQCRVNGMKEEEDASASNPSYLRATTAKRE